MAAGIEVEGLNKFSRSMRKVSADFPTRLRIGLNEAAKSVADEARAKVPQKSGRLAGTIRPSSTTRQGRVAMGGARAPYAGFIEFGGHVGRRKAVHREYIAEGRYLFPAFKRKRAEVQAELEVLLARLINES